MREFRNRSDFHSPENYGSGVPYFQGAFAVAELGMAFSALNPPVILASLTSSHDEVEKMCMIRPQILPTALVWSIKGGTMVSPWRKIFSSISRPAHTASSLLSPQAPNNPATMKVAYFLLSALATVAIAAPSTPMNDELVVENLEKRQICAGACENGRKYCYNCSNGGCQSWYIKC